MTIDLQRACEENEARKSKLINIEEANMKGVKKKEQNDGTECSKGLILTPNMLSELGPAPRLGS